MHQFLWVTGQLSLPREQYARLLIPWAQSSDLFTRRFAAHLFLYSEELARDCPQTVEALSRETNVYVSKPAQEALRKLKSGEPGLR